MKAAIFRKDNMGVVVGRLKSENIIQYEDEGSLKEFELSGNILETEFNDVFLLGKKINDVHFEVVKMESLPKKNDKYLGLKTDGPDGPIFCMAVPVDKLVDIEQQKSKNDTIYHKFHFSLNEKTTMFVNVYGAYDETPLNDCFVFLLMEPLSTEHKEFGGGFAIKKWTNYYGSGYQVLS